MLEKWPIILFISHDASLSGAPVLLLNLVRLLVDNQKAIVHFVITRDGSLADEFKKIAPTTILKSADYGKEKSFFGRFKNFISHRRNLRNVRNGLSTYDIIFSNTIVNGKLLQKLSFSKRPLITYVHELETVIDIYVRQKDA